jgi:hypothetical protein
MTFKPWTGRFFGLLFCGAMERKTGLSKWPILYRIVAAQSLPGLIPRRLRRDVNPGFAGYLAACGEVVHFCGFGLARKRTIHSVS